MFYFRLQFHLSEKITNFCVFKRRKEGPLHVIASAVNYKSISSIVQVRHLTLPHCTFFKVTSKVLLHQRWTCTPLGYFLQMGVCCPVSVMINHNFPLDSCAAKQQYFIHDSDGDLPERLRWPFFSCTTYSLSACLGNIYSLIPRSTWTQIVDGNPLATASDWLFAQLRDTLCCLAFLQGSEDWCLRDISKTWVVFC